MLRQLLYHLVVAFLRNVFFMLPNWKFNKDKALLELITNRVCCANQGMSLLLVTFWSALCVCSFKCEVFLCLLGAKVTEFVAYAHAPPYGSEHARSLATIGSALPCSTRMHCHAPARMPLVAWRVAWYLPTPLVSTCVPQINVAWSR